jgi:hypothetical protein
MDPRRNPFHREAAVEHFLCRDSQGTAVGRVAAVIHPGYVDRHGPKAFFGFFETVDDPAVASRLLAAVEAWAWERGFKTIAGPCTYTTTQEAGLLVEGFDEFPALLQSYNPPYYSRLLEGSGYRRVFELHGYTASRAVHREQAMPLVARGDAVLARHQLRVRSVDVRRYAQELETLRQVYNRAFAFHPQTAAISSAVFAEQAAEMRAILDPGLIRIVEHQGRPVAFLVALPNVNEILAPYRGRLTLGFLIRWRRLLRTVRSIVVVMIGADPTIAPPGIGRCLAAELVRLLATGQYDTMHTTWIHETNSAVHALLDRVGAVRAKRWAIYQKDVG